MRMKGLDYHEVAKLCEENRCYHESLRMCATIQADLLELSKLLEMSTYEFVE